MAGSLTRAQRGAHGSANGIEDAASPGVQVRALLQKGVDDQGLAIPAHEAGCEPAAGYGSPGPLHLNSVDGLGDQRQDRLAHRHLWNGHAGQALNPRNTVGINKIPGQVGEPRQAFHTQSGSGASDCRHHDLVAPERLAEIEIGNQGWIILYEPDFEGVVDLQAGGLQECGPGPDQDQDQGCAAVADQEADERGHTSPPDSGPTVRSSEVPSCT